MKFEQEVQTLINFFSKARLDERMIKNMTSGMDDQAIHEAFKNKEVRRNIKNLMKEQIRRQSWEHAEMKHDDLINFWVRTPEDGESADKTWIIKGDTERAKEVLDDLGQPWEGVQIHSAYDCTGQWFAWEADFVECGDRTFVTQHWGLDV